MRPGSPPDRGHPDRRPVKSAGFAGERVGRIVRAGGLGAVGHDRHRSHLRPGREPPRDRRGGHGLRRPAPGGCCGPTDPAFSAALRRQWPTVALGSVAVATYPLAFYSSMHLAGVAVGTVVSIGSAPLASAVIERIVDKRRFTRPVGSGRSAGPGGRRAVVLCGRRARWAGARGCWGMGNARRHWPGTGCRAHLRPLLLGCAPPDEHRRPLEGSRWEPSSAWAGCCSCPCWR